MANQKLVWLAWVLGAIVFALAIAQSRAQHNHAAGHGDYLNWSSRKVQNCCDNRDCGALTDDEVQETPNGTQVRIAGEWCPVLGMHYLTRGKSPDWNVAHACVSQNTYAQPCERLLCFTGKGGF